MRTAVHQHIALVAAMLILSVSGVRLATNAQDPDEAIVTLPTPSASVTPSAPAPTPTGATPTPQPTVAPTSAPSTPTPTPTADPRVAVPPKVGRYVYTVRDDGEDSDVVLEISDRGSGRQTENLEGIRTDVIWQSQGKFLERTDFGGVVCDWEPDIRDLKLPLARGSQWTFRADCEPFEGFTMEATGSTQVEELGKVTVGGTTVDTWHILSEVVVTGRTAEDTFEQRVRSDGHFAPAHGLYVRSVENSDGTNPTTGKPEKSSSSSELKSLTPG